MDDDLISFADEGPQEEPAAQAAEPWRLLVVDDDADVHKVTYLALKNFLVLQRPIALSNAYSGQEALHQINTHHSALPDLVLMDVVMDSPTDGIDTVHKIRSELHLLEIPYVIMRTGQAGTSFELHDLRKDVHIDSVMSKAEASAESLREAVAIGLVKGRDKCRLDAGR